MERLTIKELAPYLPYGLKVAHINNQLNNGYKIYFLKGITEDFRHNKNDLDGDDNNELLKLKQITFWLNDFGLNSITHKVKPLLRPLSSLTEEIEHNGERFVPMVELEKIRKGVNIYQPLNLGYPIEINIQTEDYSQEIDIYDGYLIIQKLHEWHFDTANLLGRGLALPIEGKEVEGE